MTEILPWNDFVALWEEPLSAVNWIPPAIDGDQTVREYLIEIEGRLDNLNLRNKKKRVDYLKERLAKMDPKFLIQCLNYLRKKREHIIACNQKMGGHEPLVLAEMENLAKK